MGKRESATAFFSLLGTFGAGLVTLSFVPEISYPTVLLVVGLAMSVGSLIAVGWIWLLAPSKESDSATVNVTSSHQSGGVTAHTVNVEPGDGKREER